MALDLTGLAAFAGAAPQGYDAAQQRRNALLLQQLQIAAAKRQQDALGLELSGLDGPTGMGPAQPATAPGPVTGNSGSAAPGATFQPVNPGAPPLPATSGGMQGPPGAMAAPGAGGGAAAANGAPTAPPPPAGALTAPGGLISMQSLAQRIKAANPNADPATIMLAVQDLHKLQQQDNSLETRLMVAQMAQAGQFERALAAIQGRLDAVTMQQAGADRRTAASIEGRKDVAQLQGDLREKLMTGGTLSDEDADFIARARIKGDTAVLQGLGYGNMGAANRAAVTRAMRRLGASPEEIAAADVEFQGKKAASRTAETQGARIDIGIQELQKFIPIVQRASAAIDRTQFPTLNALLLAGQRGTGGENVIRLVNAINAAKNAYAQIVTRGGRSTDDARRRSDEVLNAAWSQGQLAAGLQQLMVEAQAASAAVGDVRQGIRDTVTGKGAPAPADSGGWKIERVD